MKVNSATKQNHYQEGLLAAAGAELKVGASVFISPVIAVGKTVARSLARPGIRDTAVQEIAVREIVTANPANSKKGSPASPSRVMQKGLTKECDGL